MIQGHPCSTSVGGWRSAEPLSDMCNRPFGRPLVDGCQGGDSAWIYLDLLKEPPHNEQYFPMDSACNGFPIVFFKHLQQSQDFPIFCLKFYRGCCCPSHALTRHELTIFRAKSLPDSSVAAPAAWRRLRGHVARHLGREIPGKTQHGSMVVSWDFMVI